MAVVNLHEVEALHKGLRGPNGSAVLLDSIRSGQLHAQIKAGNKAMRHQEIKEDVVLGGTTGAVGLMSLHHRQSTHTGIDAR